MGRQNSIEKAIAELEAERDAITRAIEKLRKQLPAKGPKPVRVEGAKAV